MVPIEPVSGVDQCRTIGGVSKPDLLGRTNPGTLSVYIVINTLTVLITIAKTRRRKKVDPSFTSHPKRFSSQKPNTAWIRTTWLGVHAVGEVEAVQRIFRYRIIRKSPATSPRK